MKSLLLTTAVAFVAIPATAHHSLSSIDHALDTDIPQQWQMVCTEDHVNVRMPLAQQPVHLGRVSQVLPPGMCIMQVWRPVDNYQYKLDFARKSGNWIPLFSLQGFLGYVSADHTHVIEYQD